MQFETLYYVTL